MKLWSRAKTAAKGAYAVARSEPRHLATMVPLLEEAIALLEGPLSPHSLEESQYLLTQAQAVVIPWRPSAVPKPGVLYLQPAWARNSDEQLTQALSLLANVQATSDAEQVTKTSQVCAMRVFLSHSSRDKACAEALVDLLRTAIGIAAKDIRCTSVDGYRLPAGSNSDEVLRSEVFGCEVFIGLLSPASMASIYVMFELGARWGCGKYMAPLRVSGLQSDQLKAPLSAIHVVDGTSEADLHQLLRDLSVRLSLTLESPAVYLKQLKAFLQVSSTISPTSVEKIAGKEAPRHSKLKTAIVSSIRQLEELHGKAESMRLIEHLSPDYDFGTVLGELMQLRDAGIVRWDGNQEAPAAYVGIELVESA